MSAVLSPNSSVGIRGFSTKSNLFSESKSNVSSKTIGAELNYRWYYKDISVNSVVVKPYISYKYNKFLKQEIILEDFGDNITNSENIALGLLLGYQWVWKPGLFIGVALGSEYSIVYDVGNLNEGQVSNKIKEKYEIQTGFKPHGEIVFGFIFPHR